MTASLLAAAPLQVQRMALGAWARHQHADTLLGGLGYGDGADAVRAPVLSGAPVVDVWSSAGEVRQGRSGRVRWRHDGRWLWGALEIDEAAERIELQTLVRQAYADIFAVLQASGCPHLLRLWNYVPRINDEAQDGLERYRHFNAGRQQAFLEAGRSAFEGAPAACCLGVPDGPLCVRFLAGTQAAVPVENPRQVPAYHYPSAYGPRSPTFSRAALVSPQPGRVALLISGTASIAGHLSLHAGDVEAQTLETLLNLQAVLAAAESRCSARFALQDFDGVVYVRHAEHAETVRRVLRDHLGAEAQLVRSAVMLQADVCRADLLVEIEAHGSAAGELIA
jgi:enamine deaminase RidA (YjgF/YER057c/UK114 family)